MKTLLKISLFIMISMNALSSQLLFDFYAFYNWNKVVDIRKIEDLLSLIQRVGETSIGVAVTGGCDTYSSLGKKENLIIFVKLKKAEIASVGNDN